MEEQEVTYRTMENTIGVFLSFPAEKLYYPLKPTSVYGNRQVPATIHVMEYVEPELYPAIASGTVTSYHYQAHFRVKPEHENFFSPDQLRGIAAEGLRYTTIKINTPSRNLTEDLWVRRSVPFDVKAAESISVHSFWYGLFFFVLCSGIAGLVAGKIAYSEEKVPAWRCLVVGLFNSLTLAGVAYAVRFLHEGERKKLKKDFHGNGGLALLEDPRKRHWKVILSYVGLSVLMFIGGRIVFFPAFLAALVLIDVLSRERLNVEGRLQLAPEIGGVRIYDLKKLAFLVIFNIFTPSAVFLLLRAGSHLLQGGHGWRMYGGWRSHFFLAEFLLFLPVFAFSVFLLPKIDSFFRTKYGIKGLIVERIYPGKWNFVVAYSLSFVALTICLQFLIQHVL